MPLAETIETPRLLLRAPAVEDTDDIYAYASDPEWRKFLPLPEPYLREHTVGHIDELLSRDPELHPTWVVCTGPRVIGVVHMIFTAEHRIAEIGFGVSRSHWGQGIASEAMSATINSAFECYAQLARVRARADTENLGSRRVMEKLGMRLEAVLRQDCIIRGELRDEVVYGLLRDEWRGI